MAERSSKTIFSEEEYRKIKEMVRQLEFADSKKQKTIRAKIRRLGLYWDELPNRIPYTVANFERMFAQGVLKLDNENKLQEDKVIAQTPITSSSNNANTKTNKGRTNSDEYYVIDLCDEVLGVEASRQHKFDFLVGDAGTKLPVDAYYESLNLVIEYHEKQHMEKVSFFDKDDKLTVSGVSRGEQRKIYDQRRQDVLPEHGIKLVIISYSDFGTSKNLKRDKDNDISVVKQMLAEYIKAK